MSSEQNLINQVKQMLHNLENPEPTPMWDKMEESEKQQKKEKLIDNGFYRYIPTGKDDNGKTKWKKEPQYYDFSEFVIDEYGIMTDDSYRLIYENNHYTHASKTKLMNLICTLTQDKAKPTELDQFFKVVTAKAYKDKIQLQTPYRKINLSNGVFNLESGEFEPHNKNNFFRYCLSHKYDPKAQCPNFENYLNFVFQGDKGLIDLVQQMFGYILMGGDPIAHRAFLLYGDGRNGKSTLLDTMRYLIGDENSSAVSMKMIDKPFSMVQMDGKLANIVEESPASIDAEAFKNIVGGGRITASYKGKDEFQMKINARMVFACNTLPTFKDATSGTNDRLIIIPFNRYIKPSERDTSIKNKIFDEISGILNWAIDGYNSFKKGSFRFVEPKSVVDTLSEYREETDNVYAWAKENIEKSSSKECLVVCQTIYDSYVYECKENGYVPKGKRKFLAGIRSYAKQNWDIDVESETKRVWGDSKKVYGSLICSSEQYNALKGNLEERYAEKLINKANARNIDKVK